MPNPYHDDLGRFTTGGSGGRHTAPDGRTHKGIVAKGVKNALGLALSRKKGAGAAGQEHGGKFGKVSERMPVGIEIKPIYQRNKDGSVKWTTVDGSEKGEWKVNKQTGKPIKPHPVLNKVKTWDSVPDSVLDENLRQALRQSKGWAVEAGQEWYPGVRRLAGELHDKYKDTFKEQHGMELSPPVLAGMISCYSRNNGWIRNIVGVRQYLDNPESKNAKGEKPMHVEMKGGVDDLLGYVKKQHAAGRKDDKKIVDDFFGQYSTAPKPHNFYKSIMGDEQNGTIDRWMSRIMLHTDDADFAAEMVGAGAGRTLKNADGTKTKVEVNYGFSRMRSSMLRVAREAEFGGLTPIQMQAVAWVHLVGPIGSVGYISDLSSDSAAKAEILGTAKKRKWEG